MKFWQDFLMQDVKNKANLSLAMPTVEQAKSSLLERINIFRNKSASFQVKITFSEKANKNRRKKPASHFDEI